MDRREAIKTIATGIVSSIVALRARGHEQADTQTELDLISDKAQLEEDVAYWKRQFEIADSNRLAALEGLRLARKALNRAGRFEFRWPDFGKEIDAVAEERDYLKTENLRLRQKVNGLITCFVPYPYESEYYLESDSVDADGNWHPVFAQVEEEPISQEEYYEQPV